MARGTDGRPRRPKGGINVAKAGRQTRQRKRFNDVSLLSILK